MTEKRGQNVGKNIVEKWGNRKKRGVAWGREGAKREKRRGKERAKEVSNGGQNNRQKVGNL